MKLLHDQNRSKENDTLGTVMSQDTGSKSYDPQLDPNINRHQNPAIRSSKGTHEML